MEKEFKKPITVLYEKLKKSDIVRFLIPMGYVAALPVLTVKNDQLVAMVPFLRYKVTGQVDRTLVYPVRYIMEYAVPELQVVGFRDLAFDPGYAEQNFDSVVGFFRHEAIKHLNREAYRELKGKILGLYDKLVNYLTEEDTDFSVQEEEELKKNLRILLEPFLWSEYARLDRDFFNKYLSN